VIEFNQLQTMGVCLGWPTKPHAARHRVIKYPPRRCEGDGGKGATCLGATTGRGYSCRQCECNMVNAFCLRHAAAAPPVTEAWDHAHTYWDRFTAERPWVGDEYGRGDFQQWMTRWPQSKRAAIMHSIDHDDVMPGLLNVNVKSEVAISNERPTKSRLIQYYPNLATQAEYGFEFVALQKSLFAWVESRPYHGIQITFASGLAPSGLADWMTRVLARYPKPYFYERDGKNWDSCMMELHHALRMRIYRAFSPGLAAFVDAGFKATGTAKFPEGVFKYFINGSNKSGHSDTSLFNSIINASICLEALMRLGYTGEILVAGDDVLVVSDCDLTPMGDIEKGFGITPAFHVFRDPIDVSFISGCWLPSTAGWMFVPKLGRLLRRLWWTVCPPPPKKVAAYRSSIVSGLQQSCGTIPLYRAFIRAEHSASDYDLGRDYKYWFCNFGGDAADSVTMDAVCRKYDMYPSEVRQLEEFFMTLPFKPCTISHPLIDRIEAVDLADPMDRPFACSA